jgi:hypothetical protein
LPPGRVSGAEAITVVGGAIDDLAGEVLTRDAPDGVVIVRLVGTTQSCAELAASGTFDPERLVGCAHSCPGDLDEIHGDLLLSLEGVGRDCEGAVRVCASDDFDPAAGERDTPAD